MPVPKSLRVDGPDNARDIPMPGMIANAEREDAARGICSASGGVGIAALAAREHVEMSRQRHLAIATALPSTLRDGAPPSMATRPQFGAVRSDRRSPTTFGVVPTTVAALQTASGAATTSKSLLIARVLLPFAAGYYLSYVFRTINALIAGDLTSELNLSAADLGVLTSVYFLIIAAVQLPLGALLDRYGPRSIASVLLLFASAGAIIFAIADDLVGLVIGRACIGLGVSIALMAGLKAIILWFPPQRVVIANGWLVMLGALGAVTATAPAEVVVQAIGWRGLFALLAGLSAAASLLILLVVPERPRIKQPAVVRKASLWGIYRDPRFWRIAPLSSVAIGASWSLQGLWAAPWLRDVAELDRTQIVAHLSVMAISLSMSALLIGTAAGRLARFGLKPETLLAATFGLSMAAQTALLLGWPLPSYLLFSVIAAAGAATVLSFAILAQYFPKEMSGRANAALNLLHIGSAFLLQSATGFIIAWWPEVRGSYPAEAHRVAMAAILLLQIAALIWFALPRRLGARVKALGAARALRVPDAWPRSLRYRAPVWTRHALAPARPASQWRFAAAASALLCIALASALSIAVSRPAVAVYVVDADRSTEAAGIDHPPGTAILMTVPGAVAPAAPDQTLKMRSAEPQAGAVRPRPIGRPLAAMRNGSGGAR